MDYLMVNIIIIDPRVEPHHGSWGLGYTRGWSQGCRDSGRSGENCNVQEDADTP